MPTLPPLAALAAALATAAAVHAQDTFYVDDDAPPGGDGRSWNTAFNDLQDALQHEHSIPGLGPTVKIAQGLYTPDRGTGDRFASFTVTSGMTLIGGFAGRGAPDPDAYDPAAFVSTLSGDLASDDGPSEATRTDNSQHVVDCRFGRNAFLRGLTVRAGRALASGGLAQGAGLILGDDRNTGFTYIDVCRFIDNRADGDGGAIGVSNYGTAYLSDCWFISNSAGGNGGAVSMKSGSADRCEFLGNSANRGGALFADSITTIRSCLLAHNSATLLGGAVDCPNNEFQMFHCTLTGNQAPQGSALWVRNSHDYTRPLRTLISASIFRDNPATQPGGFPIHVDSVGSPPRPVIIESCLLQWGRFSILGTDYEYRADNLDAQALFADSDGPDDNPTTFEDNNYRLLFHSPGVDVIEAPAEDLGARDLDGGARSAAGGCGCRPRTDMGAYELPPGSCPLPALRVHVRADAAPGGDGSSWASALPTLSAALEAPGVREIWVAAGTYRSDAPFVGTRPGVLIGCRVDIRGGFTGIETSADQRRAAGPDTVFTGDRLGDDTPAYLNRADNAPVILEVRGGRVLLDRVTITGAAVAEEPSPDAPLQSAVLVNGGEITATGCVFSRNTGRNGPALSVRYGVLDLRGCRFADNRADLALSAAVSQNYGGAVRLLYSNATLNRCEFIGNRVSGNYHAQGGAISADQGSLTVERCVFTANQARAATPAAKAGGGAIHHNGYYPGTELTLLNCQFTGNLATSSLTNPSHSFAEGGALVGLGEGWNIIGCAFTGNTAFGYSGATGGASSTDFGSPRFTNCTFVNNTAAGWIGFGRVGGVYWSNIGNPSLYNCILWNNRDDAGSTQTSQVGFPSWTDGQPTITRCIIQGWDGSLGGIANSAIDPLLLNPRGPDNLPGTEDDDLRLAPNSPAIDFADSAAYPLTSPGTDAAGAPRFIDDPGAPNAGFGPSPFLDLGAYEFQGVSCRADWDRSGDITIGDVFAFLPDFFAGRADYNRVDGPTLQDLFDFLTAYFAGCP